jgi:hypothetical protein
MLNKITPININDANLSESNLNVPRTTAFWNRFFTYNIGDEVFYQNKFWRAIIAQNASNYKIPTSDNNSDPENPPTHWLFLNTENKYAMFDDSSQTKSVGFDEIYCKINLTSRIDSVVFFGLKAQSIEVTLSTPRLANVYQKTINLKQINGNIGLYNYLFSKRIFAERLTLLDLPSYSQSTLTIRILGAGTVECGLCVIGKKEELGAVEYQLKVSETHYTTVTKAFDGTIPNRIVIRGYSDDMTLRLWVKSEDEFRVKKMLSDSRGLPTLWIGDEDRSVAQVYGIYNGSEVSIDYPTYSIFSVQIAGLV